VRDPRNVGRIWNSDSAGVWEKRYAGHVPETLGTYFLVAHLPAEFGTITFGEEGEQWKIMSIEEFLDHPEVVSHLKMRLQDYLSQNQYANGN
jgi:8-oxo-dGTP diphosphatase